MPDDSPTFTLPAVMRTADAVALHAFLSENHSAPVTLDASQVEKFSGQAAQVIAAHQKWRAGTENTITVAQSSAALTAASQTLGLDLGLGGTA